MNARCTSRRGGGFTLIELLCVIGIIGILAALLLPTLAQGQARARRIACVSDLRQIGLAFHLFAHDHESRFPMQVPISDGGSLEYLQMAYRTPGESYWSFHHFEALAPELTTPRPLACPGDTRPPAVNFVAFNNTNLSYFVAANAQFDKPNSLLAGDRNLTNNWPTPQTILLLDPNNSLRWVSELHRFRGNILFADGHVEEANKPALIYTVNNTFAAAILLLPSVRSADPLAYAAGPGPAMPAPTPVYTPPPVQTPPPVETRMPVQTPLPVYSPPAYSPPSEPMARPFAAVTAPQPSMPPPAVTAGQALPTGSGAGMTSSIAKVAQTNSAAAPAPASSDSFWFADALDDVVRKVEQVSWILWLLLLLILLVLIVRLWLLKRHNA